jgi:hypothetical protein
LTCEKPSRRKARRRRDEQKGRTTWWKQRLHRPFLAAIDAAMERRAIWQRIKEFFAGADQGPEMMHLDARYRDTLGAECNLRSATTPAAPFKIRGPSFQP